MNALRAVAARLHRATPRERAGLALLTAFCVCALALLAFDWTMSARTRAQAAVDARAQLEAASARAGEPAFQEEVALAAGKIWRWSAVGASAGVARAEASTQLESLAIGAGLTNVSVTATETSVAANRLSAIKLALSADFDWGSFTSFLRALENAELSFSVEGVDVAAGASPTMALSIAVPFLQEERQ